jgi:hypothetical protein
MGTKRVVVLTDESYAWEIMKLLVDAKLPHQAITIEDPEPGVPLAHAYDPHDMGPATPGEVKRALRLEPPPPPPPRAEFADDGHHQKQTRKRRKLGPRVPIEDVKASILQFFHLRNNQDFMLGDLRKWARSQGLAEAKFERALYDMVRHGEIARVGGDRYNGYVYGAAEEAAVVGVS